MACPPHASSAAAAAAPSPPAVHQAEGDVALHVGMAAGWARRACRCGSGGHFAPVGTGTARRQLCTGHPTQASCPTLSEAPFIIIILLDVPVLSGFEGLSGKEIASVMGPSTANLDTLLLLRGVTIFLAPWRSQCATMNATGKKDLHAGLEGMGAALLVTSSLVRLLTRPQVHIGPRMSRWRWGRGPAPRGRHALVAPRRQRAPPVCGGSKTLLARHPMQHADLPPTFCSQAGLGFLALTMASALSAALGPAVARYAPGWHTRHRTALTLLPRLALVASFIAPTPLPLEGPSSCPAFLWLWLLWTSAPPFFFTCISRLLPAG